MCRKCGDNEHDERILILPGEMISINAKSLSDSDAKTVNNFMRFARAYQSHHEKNSVESAKELIKAAKELNPDKWWITKRKKTDRFPGFQTGECRSLSGSPVFRLLV